MSDLIILGAGGHGRVVADCAAAAGWNNIRLLDDRFPNLVMAGPWPVVGRIDEWRGRIGPGVSFIVGLGDNLLRERWCRNILAAGGRLARVIHPRAAVSPHAQVQDGTVCMPNCVVNIGASVGLACIVNSGAVVEHDCVLGDAVHVCPGAVLAGGVVIGGGTTIGAGASVVPQVRIGRGVTIGAGAAVLRDVPDDCTAVGVPARPVAPAPGPGSVPESTAPD